jgi:hypothetical protein
MQQLPNILFNSFKSVNEITQSEKLSPEELVALDNMRLDEYAGVPTTRKGFSRYGTTPVQVDTTGNINSIFDVEDVNGNNYILSAIGTKLRISANGTSAYSDIKTGLTNNLKLRMAVLGENHLFTNGTDKPFYTSDLATSQNLEIAKPDVALVGIASTTGSTLGNGFYSYILVYLTNDGQHSNASVPISLYSANGTGTYDSIILTGLPISSDARVTSKQLFRTKGNGFQEYYLVASLDNAITSYTDITPDAKLDTTTTFEYMYTPNAAKFICVNSDRPFFGNIKKAYENRVVPIAHVDYNHITLGDYITAVTSGTINAGTYKYGFTYVDINNNESELVHFLDYTFTGYSQITFQYFPLPIISFVSSIMLYNASIKYVRFYRTKNAGSIYYYIGDFSPSSYIWSSTSLYTFTDNRADASLTVPYAASGHGSNEQVDLASSIIYGNVNTFLEYPELNYIEIYPDDEDEITGIFDDDNGIVVFKQRSICKFYTNGDPSNWQVVKLVTNKGCDQPDSIYKYGNSYYFVFENKVYVFNGGSAEEEISYKRKLTFNSVTTFLGSTFWDDSLWYVLAVEIGSAYYLLCYDIKLKTWYKFSISKADTIAKKQFGTSAGQLLIGGNLYITTYNELQSYDNDTGSDSDILIYLKTKDYSVDDFIRMRLMFFFVDYYRLHNTASNQITFALTDPKTNTTISLTDASDTEDEPIWRISTDGMYGRLRRANKINFSFYGYALNQFIGGRLDYNPETWGNHFKHPNALQLNIIVDDNTQVLIDDNAQILIDNN